MEQKQEQDQMEMPEQESQKFWQGSKLFVKGLLIFILILLLLIPIEFVKNLIAERAQVNQEAITEVRSKWAHQQNLKGPVLILPYEKQSIVDSKQVVTQHIAYFLPENLNYNIALIPEKRKRGIYEVVLYVSQIKMEGGFKALPIDELQIKPEMIKWKEAKLFVGITDLKGLQKDFEMKLNGQALSFVPSMEYRNILGEGLVANFSLNDIEDEKKDWNFSSQFDLKGTKEFTISPIGKFTQIQMQSEWSDPSFMGSQLPETWEKNENGFIAKWTSMSHNRSFPQFWTNASMDMEFENTMGVNLFVSVTNYQKTERSIKYAILCILLTFSVFFLIEVINKKSVHPIQYVLVGFALVLFYTLLLSFSEHIGFNAAYLIAAIAIVALITWFTRSILSSQRLSLVFSFVLIVLYSYVFTTLQIDDYALLFGSVGLFVMLAVVMFFTRKIRW